MLPIALTLSHLTSILWSESPKKLLSHVIRVIKSREEVSEGWNECHAKTAECHLDSLMVDDKPSPGN